MSETTTITCVRCGTAATQMPERPLGGAIGREVHARVCGNCWEEWKAQQILIINHYGLLMHLPEHRAQLVGMMKEFFGLIPASEPVDP